MRSRGESETVAIRRSPKPAVALMRLRAMEPRSCREANMIAVFLSERGILRAKNKSEEVVGRGESFCIKAKEGCVGKARHGRW